MANLINLLMKSIKSKEKDVSRYFVVCIVQMLATSSPLGSPG